MAVVDADEALTYEELDARSDAIAATLAAHGADGTRVGISLRRSHWVPTAILGVLKAGCSYVPIDPAYPEARRHFVAQDAAVSAVIVDDDSADVGACPAETFAVEALARTRPTGALPDVAASDDAYVIYTSGSTGAPKGVRVTHGNVTSLLSACQPTFRFSHRDRWTMFHSYSFDFSVWEMWGALSRGGRLVVVPAEATASPDRFLHLLLEHQVSVLNQVPSAFTQLSRYCESVGTWPRPRFVVFGGERLDAEAVHRWRRRGHAESRLFNMYGITETTVHVTLHEIDDLDDLDDIAGEASPIGRPLPHLAVHLLDDALQPVEEGPGEMWISGAGVAAGYLNRDALTRERFRCLDSLGGRRAYASGDLAVRTPTGLGFLGRKDEQLKIRGHRIEAGEVEAALRRHGAVLDAIVTSAPLARGELGLVALCTTAARSAPPGPELRGWLSSHVPSYLVPTLIHTVDELPRLPSGKLDRAGAAAIAAALFRRQSTERDTQPAYAAKET